MATAGEITRASTESLSAPRIYTVSMAWARWVSLAVLPLAAGSLIVAAWAVATGVDGAALSWLLLSIVIAIPALIFGHLITHRFPHHAVGALLSAAGLVMVTLGANDTYLAAAQIHPELPINNVLMSLAQGSWMVLYLPWALMLLIFPSGRFESLGARLIAGGLVLVAILFSVLVGLGPTPYANEFQEQHRGLGPVLGADVAALSLLPVFLLLLVLSLRNVIKRFKNAEPTLKNQIRWLAVAGASVPGTLLLCWIGYLIFQDSGVVILGLAAMNIVIPMVLGMAVVRTVPLDAGRVLVATVSSLILLGGIGLWALLLLRWPGVESSPAAVVTVAGVALGTLFAAGFRPRLRRGVGRILYAEHERILDAVATLQRQVFANTARPTELEAVLRKATRDPGLRLGFTARDGSLHDVAGRPVEKHDGVEVSLEHRIAGIIIPGRDLGRALNAESIKALFPLLEMARQQLELAQALAEVEASRGRLLLATHEERRRLERDLHDGAQQRLVAVGMGLRLIQHHLPPHSEDIRGKLDVAVTELGTAVAELRQIAHGVRPSALDDGLPAALRQLSGRSPTPLHLEIAEPVPELSEIVGATAYFVASEAVHNALKHAQAQRVQIVLAQHGSLISLMVSDDGLGGAHSTAGGGLSGLRDRVNAAGGQLSLTSIAGQGTTVEAIMPCG